MYSVRTEDVTPLRSIPTSLFSSLEKLRSSWSQIVLVPEPRPRCLLWWSSCADGPAKLQNGGYDTQILERTNRLNVELGKRGDPVYHLKLETLWLQWTESRRGRRGLSHSDPRSGKGGGEEVGISELQVYTLSVFRGVVLLYFVLRAHIVFTEGGWRSRRRIRTAPFLNVDIARRGRIIAVK